jgi:hypothetical protein
MIFSCGRFGDRGAEVELREGSRNARFIDHPGAIAQILLDNFKRRRKNCAMSSQLQHFAGSDLRLDREQARLTLKFFFPSAGIDHVNITDDDRSFAQALLVEAIDASAQMGYVQILFEHMYKPPTGFDFIKDLAKDLVKYGSVTWYRHLSGKDFSDPKIYLSVRNTIQYQWGSVWDIRLQTDQLTY